jgi:hypothetical protein
MFDPADSERADDQPALYECDADLGRCHAREATEGEFFACPTCGLTLCPDHADGKQMCHGEEVCLICFEKDRDKAAEADYSNGGY